MSLSQSSTASVSLGRRPTIWNEEMTSTLLALREENNTCLQIGALMGLSAGTIRNRLWTLREQGVAVPAYEPPKTLQASPKRLQELADRYTALVPLLRAHMAAGGKPTVFARAHRLSWSKVASLAAENGIPFPKARAVSEAHQARQMAPIRREWAAQVWQLLCSGVALKRVAAMYGLPKPTVQALRAKLAERGMRR